MMAGAKSERGFDLDSNVIGLDRAASMRAMHDKAPRSHRTKSFKRGGNPVAFTHLAEGHSAGGGARGHGNEGANIRFVGRRAEIDFDGPGTLVPAAFVRRFL